MKVNITVEVPEGSAATLAEDVLASLSGEQKSSLALEVIRAWLNEDWSAERMTEEARVVRGLLASTRYGAPKTEAEARAGYEFGSAMRAYQSQRETIVAAVVKATTEHAVALARKAVESDPRVAAMIEAAVASVGEALPTLLLETIAGTMWNAATHYLHGGSDPGRSTSLTDLVANAIERIRKAGDK